MEDWIRQSHGGDGFSECRRGLRGCDTKQVCCYLSVRGTTNVMLGVGAVLG